MPAKKLVVIPFIFNEIEGTVAYTTGQSLEEATLSWNSVLCKVSALKKDSQIYQAIIAAVRLDIK